MAKKILLAEDSVTMQRVVQMTFAAEDFTVTSVATSDDALARAAEMDPDVVIADLSMPGKNGYDLCAALKRDGDRFPVLLMHGSAAQYDAARGRQARADGDIGKPFDSQALIDKVNELVSAERVGVPGPIESLAAPIESANRDIVIDTGFPAEPPRPIPAAPVAAFSSVREPADAVPPAMAPAPRRPVPMPVPAAAAPPVARAPAVAPLPPMTPAPLSVPPPMAATAAPSERPITIEAQLPPGRPEPLHPFNRPTPAPLPAIESARGTRPAGTLIGLGGSDLAPPPELPPPPPGLGIPVGAPLPPVVAPPPAAAAPVSAAARDAGVDPAVYDAIAKLSRDVVERIVWEVVPDLAETIIREQLDRLMDKRAK